MSFKYSKTYDEWAKSINFIGMDKRIGQNIWNACKEEVIKVLHQPIQNCDLSYDTVDDRFIEKIKNL
jgi:hypothetical protein